MEKRSTDAGEGAWNDIDSVNLSQAVLMGIEEWLFSRAAPPSIVKLVGGSSVWDEIAIVPFGGEEEIKDHPS